MGVMHTIKFHLTQQALVKHAQE